MYKVLRQLCLSSCVLILPHVCYCWCWKEPNDALAFSLVTLNVLFQLPHILRQLSALYAKAHSSTWVSSPCSLLYMIQLFLHFTFEIAYSLFSFIILGMRFLLSKLNTQEIPWHIWTWIMTVGIFEPPCLLWFLSFEITEKNDTNQSSQL